jgi:ketosteroid isomerase-like protein
VSIRIEGSAAWVAFDWELDGAFADGSPAKFTGWETQVHRKTADGWRIAHVHYSVPFVVPTAPQ